MWIFYHNVVEAGGISLQVALSVPLLLVGIGLYADSFLKDS